MDESKKFSPGVKTKKVYTKLVERELMHDENGEVKEVSTRIISLPNEVDIGFTKIFNAFSIQLATDERLAGKSIRLLFYIINELDYNRLEVYLHPPTVMRELNISKTTFHAWKKTLMEIGIIEKVATNLYRINPTCVFKGKAHKLIDEWLEPHKFKQEEKNE